MPDWAQHVRARLSSLSLSPAREAEIIEELSQHLDDRYEEFRSGGASEADARRLALDELSDQQSLANDIGSLRQAYAAPRAEPGAASHALLDGLWQDLRHTARIFRAQPAFTAVALLMLALGIGATTAIFSVVHGVLIKPLPYPDSDALVSIVHSVGGTDQPYFSDVIFATYEENSRTFLDVGVWTPAAMATVTGRGDPEELRTLLATRGLLTTLGVRPEIGRVFSVADDTPGEPAVVILTHGYWQRKFAGDRGVLGQTLTINARPHEIIGVLPQNFRFDGEHDLVLPRRVDRARLIPFFRHLGVARLKPGVTLAQANADAARILRIWLVNSGQNDPAFQARYAPSLRPLKEDVVGDVGATLWVLMGTIGLVLLMACANVANLVLVRADARRQEFAIRAALGARWTRTARSLLAEGLTLGVVGGVLGLGVAYGGLRLLVAIGPSNLPRLSEISLDSFAILFALTVSLLSGVLVGLAPIVKYAGLRFATAMVDAGRGSTLSRERQQSQNTLVTIQVALALILLVSAALMIRTFQALRSVDPGFTQPQYVQTFGVPIPPTVVADGERLTQMQHEILDRIAAIPGVVSAAFTTRLPMDPTDRWSAALTAEGTPDDGRTPPNRQVKLISPGMFQTLGTRLLAGRDFTWTDLYDLRSVAIVSANLAREVWGSPAAALGRRVREYYGPPEGRWLEIVGVAADVYDDGVHEAPPATIYWPGTSRYEGYEPRRVSVAIRTERTDTEGLLNQVHEAVWSVNSSLPVAQVSTLGDIYDRSMARTSFTLVTLAMAGAMALLLGIVGIYGVVSYAVSQRRREIGIRVVLGAQAGEIQRLFVRRGLVLVAVGVAIGLVGAAGFTRLMRSLLFGVNPLDLVTFVVVPCVLAATAVMASYLPARRALAVDPVETMRAE